MDEMPNREECSKGLLTCHQPLPVSLAPRPLFPHVDRRQKNKNALLA
jgi:hypothetical protein